MIFNDLQGLALLFVLFLIIILLTDKIPHWSERLQELALLNVHRDISVSVGHLIDRFSNCKWRLLYFVTCVLLSN